jgi:hypothetical protein
MRDWRPTDSRRLVHRELPTVGELLEQARLKPEQWDVYVTPPADMTASKRVEAKPTDVLSATMSLVLHPK